MAPSTIRMAIGAVKDQTTIGLAKVSSNNAPKLDVAIVRATSHSDGPAHEKHIREILSLTSLSRGYVFACVATVSRRLAKTRDWVVALKALMLVHRLFSDGDPAFRREILHATRRGARLLNMSDFRDEAHSGSWDHSAFVRSYALYLDQLLDCTIHGSKHSGGGDGPFHSPRDSHQQWRSHRQSLLPRPETPLREMKPEKVLARIHQLQQLLNRFLACRPAGLAKTSRMVFVALYPIVKESFQLYADICEVLAVLLDRFFDMEYAYCVKVFEVYAGAAKQIDELAAFYTWCRDTGMARSSEYPEVQRITAKLLETLEEFLKDREKRATSSPRGKEEPATAAKEEGPGQDMNSIKALPAPPYYDEQLAVKEETRPELEPQAQPQPQGDLVDLREDAVTADSQGNKLALALFSTGTWEAFPSAGSGEGEVISAWQTPAAEQGKADWELALVETASNLEKQKAALGGGFDPLLLNGMYDQEAVRQHASTLESAGSASGVALLGSGKIAEPVMALPAPDGAVRNTREDPFAASLSIPPPSYVQMVDIEKKQPLLVQEHQMWLQYANDGMQGQASLAKLNKKYFDHNPAMQYGMPPTALHCYPSI